MNALRQVMHLDRGPALRTHAKIFEPSVELLVEPGGLQWPMDDGEECPFAPPWPSKEHAEAMRLESAHRLPQEELGPLAKQWTADLQTWYFNLQRHFKFDPSDLASNVYRSRERWRRRLQYLNESDPAKFNSIMSDITVGHRIPFREPPKRFFRRRNPPSLANDKKRAWAAISKDMAHGAIRLVDIKAEGIPHCVCPVRTADKSDGTARFVHNSRRVNKVIDRKDVQCALESLLKTRNIYIPGGYAIGSDFASGYHCLRVFADHQKYTAFALHTSELPDDALRWLTKEHPEAFLRSKGCFIFIYKALPFGLSSSCKAFNDLITALVGFWRRCRIQLNTVRASSYIDDISAVQKHFECALEMAIRMVFEAASLGLLFKIKKCSFFPKSRLQTLGTVVDLESFSFAVSARRAAKIRGAIQSLSEAVRRDWRNVPARAIASLVGLIWSIAPCCHRAASVMLRAITAVLTVNMRQQLQNTCLSLKTILSVFWAGSVQWSAEAERQLQFWHQVEFENLSAPISADVLGKSAELVVEEPSRFNRDTVSIVCQDASDTASGGCVLTTSGGKLMPTDQWYLAEFADGLICEESSTWREIMGILWCLRATARVTQSRIVFLCDNLSACLAVARGSANPRIQRIAEQIFLCCLKHGKTCLPVWVPRTNRSIQEADRLSRTRIPHDDKSPTYVVRAANRLAVEIWDAQLSFDQAASHKSAIEINSRQLPFNAFCMQPGASGVDMFRQWDSWRHNVNYVYPPLPMLGRLITFLQHTAAKVIVAFKGPVPAAWWSHAVQPFARGVVASVQIGEFIIVAFDFSTTSRRPSNYPTNSACMLEHQNYTQMLAALILTFPYTAGSKKSRESALRAIRDVAEQDAPTCPQVSKDLSYADGLIAQAVSAGSWKRNQSWINKFQKYVALTSSSSQKMVRDAIQDERLILAFLAAVARENPRAKTRVDAAKRALNFLRAIADLPPLDRNVSIRMLAKATRGRRVATVRQSPHLPVSFLHCIVSEWGTQGDWWERQIALMILLAFCSIGRGDEICACLRSGIAWVLQNGRIVTDNKFVPGHHCRNKQCTRPGCVCGFLLLFPSRKNRQNSPS